MMIVDAFSHFYPKEYVKKWLSLAQNLEFELDRETGRHIIFEKSSHYPVSFVKTDSTFDSVDIRLKHMEKYGIDKQAISVANPTLNLVGAHSRQELARIANDSIADIAHRYPERFIPIGNLALTDPGDAMDELKRAVHELGMRGFLLFTTEEGGKPLDSEEFFPVLEEIAKLNLTILLHPTYPSIKGLRDYERDYELPMLFNWPYGP